MFYYGNKELIMRGVLVFTIIVLFVFPAMKADAEEIALDVETAVSLALQNNLGLQTDRIDLEIKERAKQTAWNEFLPSIDAGAGLTRSVVNQGGASSVSGSTPWSVSANIRTSLPLSLSGRYSIQDAKLSFDEEAISLEDAEKQLVRDVKKAFFNLLLLTEKIRLTEQNIATAQKRYDQAKTSYEYGLESELTLLGALVTLENLKPDLERIRVTSEIADMELKQMLGFDSDSGLTFTGSIEPNIRTFDVEDLIEEHLETRPDIAAIMKDIEALEIQKKITRLDVYTPLLSLSYSYVAGLNDPFQSGAATVRGTNTFGISLSYPIDGLIPGSSGNVDIKDMDDSIKKAQIELAEARQLAEIEIESTVLRLDNSSKASRALEQNVILAQKVYDLTEKEYSAGEGELLKVEDAFDDLQKAKLSVLEERYNYISGLFDLEYELNTELDI
ncbi:MAG TPA: TolC family protein [Spirochaetes bacterium]|nr:TolC family protein [Spirochaetota bacterium]